MQEVGRPASMSGGAWRGAARRAGVIARDNKGPETRSISVMFPRVVNAVVDMSIPDVTTTSSSSTHFRLSLIACIQRARACSTSRLCRPTLCVPALTDSPPPSPSPASPRVRSQLHSWLCFVRQDVHDAAEHVRGRCGVLHPPDM